MNFQLVSRARERTEAVSFELEYYLLEDEGYGVMCVKRVQDVIDELVMEQGLPCTKEFLISFLEILSRNTVTPGSLREVLEDAIHAMELTA